MKALLSMVMLCNSVARLAMGVVGLGLVWRGQYLEGSAVISAAALSRISLDLGLARVGIRSMSTRDIVAAMVADIRKA